MNHPTSGELGEQIPIKYGDDDTQQGGADPRRAMTNSAQQHYQQPQKQQQQQQQRQQQQQEQQQIRQETKAQLLAINLCLQQSQQHQKLQQHPLDQTQLLQTTQQQRDIYNTISSIAEAIRSHLLQQKLLHQPNLQKPKPRQLYIQQAHELDNKILKHNKKELDMLQYTSEILEHNTINQTELQMIS